MIDPASTILTNLSSLASQAKCDDIDTTSLGPNAKYVAKAREARRKEEEERRRKLGTSRNDRGYTDASMAERAAEMLENAKQREDYVVKRGTQKVQQHDDEELKNPHFLKYVILLLPG